MLKLTTSATILTLIISGVAAPQPISLSDTTPAAAAEETTSEPVVCVSNDGTSAPQSRNVALDLPDYQAIVSPSDKSERRLTHDGATLAIMPSAVRLPTGIGITSLHGGSQVPALDPGMTNVTGKVRNGFKFTPHPMQFAESIEVSLPYDPALLTDEFTAQDIYTYFFDEPGQCWRRLIRVRVDEALQVVVSLTDHFTDMINATVSVPDHPENVSFNPNQLKDLQAADPSAAVNLIAPPKPSHQGDNQVSYPLEVPPGRLGLQPKLAVHYDSSRGNSWLGMGWDLNVPAITIETRWGVPRYEAADETETYVLNGEHLTPVAHRSAKVPRTAEKVFHTRVESAFARIIRHGTAPANYSWEITDKAGTKWRYGTGAESRLTGAGGNIFAWHLREVQDTHGNLMRYHYANVNDAGVDNGTVPGTNLYLARITYSGRQPAEGRYSVTFLRDRELGEPLRLDKTIDARGGFKRVTADLLRRVEVKLDSTLIRRYELAYTTGAFHKTLLRSVTQQDENGAVVNTHRFDYFDDIRDGQGRYQAFQPAPWTVPGDDLSKDILNLTPEQAGEASAINSNTSFGGGGHLYVGVGTQPSKSGSIGLKVGFSHDSEEGLLALIDVDGDTLPDKVFKKDNTIWYRKNLAKPGGPTSFAAQPAQLNLPGIMGESSDTLTLGIEAYFGGVAAQLDYINTFSTTDQYFSDVNGDGISDLVTGASVLFGRIGPSGVPVYGLNGDTPAPITPGTIDPTGIFGDFGPDRERLIDSFPLLDTVRRWVAPFDGTVRVEGGVRLSPQTAAARAASRSADGVKVAIQLENDVKWSDTIGPQDNNEHLPSGVSSLTVAKGQRLYFRLQSNFDGGLDQVDWDPVVTYTGVTASNDVNGLANFTYRASRDFTLGGRSPSLKAPLTGSVQFTGDFVKRGPTSDNIVVAITADGNPLFQQTLSGAAGGTAAININRAVQSGQVLRWEVRADSPIDLDQIEWTPRAFYTAAQGADRINDANGNPLIDFFPPYATSMYPINGLTAPQGFYDVPADGNRTVEPQLFFNFGGQTPTARVAFTVKRRGALIAKRFFDINAGVVISPGAFSIAADGDDELFFDFSTADPKLRNFLTSHKVTVDGANVPNAFHSSAEEGAFPQPYRGWGAIGYNGNRDRANQAVVQNDLVVDENFGNQIPDSVDPQAQKDAFRADPRINPPKVSPFLPSPRQGRWAAGEHNWAARSTASSSRMGVESINLPRPSDFAGAVGVPRLSRSQQISTTGSVGGPIGSIGGSIATGDSTGEVDFFDLNGDQFPDVAGAGGIQYTDPTGGLGGTRGSMPDGAVRRSTNESGNASAGSAARTITTGRGYGAPPGNLISGNTSESGNDMPPLGVGGSLGESSSDGRFDLLDANGDGLPDRVYADGRVALNLGYSFAQPEQWRNPAALNDGEGGNFGINIGFNTDFYGFAGGASYNEGSVSSDATLLDVNGDGLADRVIAGTPIKVGLNTGNGFQPPVDFHGSLSSINNDQNAKLGGGVYFTIPICFIVVCIIINPGGDISTGASRSEFALRDLNGDGFADHLSSSRDNGMTVVQNTTGRTNLLRSVARPLGATMQFDYKRDGNTYDQPNSRFVLSRVAVHDGHAGDGADVQLATYDYENGVFSRLEREFFGYGKVTEHQRDAGNGDAIYRTVVREYRNDSHYGRGLMTRELTTDAAGRPFLETINTYFIPDAASTTATIFPKLERVEKRFYEGNPAPGKTTFTSTEYDALGNVTRTFDSGDIGAADDVEIRIRYTAEDALCQQNHLVGTPKAIDVFGNGTLMRHREANVDCANGELRQVRAFLANGQASISDLEYFPDGNLKAVISPVNENNQRFRLDYTYDPGVATHVASVTDSFGLRSATTYNLKYGLPETSTDTNGQVVRNTYDALGRVDTVTGPYEAPENRISVDYEYHPEAVVPYAITRHVDRQADGSVRADTIDTVTFIDGLKRVVQTKKDAAVHTGENTAPADVMAVSGRSRYDFVGRVVEHFYPVTEPKGAANITFNPVFDPVAPTRTTFDILDRTTRSVLPDNTVNAVQYGFGAGRSGTPQFEIKTTDPNGKVKFVYEDVRTLKTSVKEFNPAGGQPVIWTSYGYDALQQPTSTTDDHNNVSTQTYDNLGRQTVVNQPDEGRTETVYDPAGNPVRKISAKLAAQNLAIEYDYEFNRLTAIRYPLFTANNVTYTYGAPGAPNHSAGRITNIVDGAGTLAREYGPLGETTKETRVSPAQGSHIHTFVTEYRFDTWNRALGITYPDGERLSYRYNSGGQVDAATGVKGEFTYDYLRRLDYDKFEQRALLDTGNGTRTRYTYNAADRRLDNMHARLANGYVFDNLNYQYDDAGNVTAIQNDTLPPSGPEVGMQVGGPSQQTFRYDDLYRLTHAEGSYQSRKPHLDRYRFDLSYDSIHNLTNKNQVHELVSLSNVKTDQKLTYNYNYAYNGPQPHAPTTIGIFTLAYDANGNQVSRAQQPRPRRQMIWDEENRLACSHENVQSHTLPQTPASCDNAGGTPNNARYFYNDKGERIVKDGAQFHIYPNQNFSIRGNQEFKHIYIGKTKLITKFVEPVHRLEDRQYYSHGDHLGSTGFVTDIEGGLSEHTKYFPGGETWVSEHPSQPVPHQFTGKEFDPETQLYYFGARYYDPRTQVWQTPDPALPESARDSKDLSAYLYANANPLKMVDPDGRQPVNEEALGDEVMLTQNRFYQETYTENVTVSQQVQKRGGGDFMVGALMVGGVTSQLDSPVPGPADVAGVIIIAGGALIAGALWLSTTSTTTITRTEPITRTRTRERPITYVTYTKINPATGEVYVGRSAGYGTPQAIVAARDAGHHMTALGFTGPATLDKFMVGRGSARDRSDPAYLAIRGREQQMIDALGGSWSDVGRGNTQSGNAIRGVAKANPNGRTYHGAASAAFGQIAPYTGY
ncbi:MAG TPA: SpvB/TcaC N-terminal domain-containing protein [Candidatus Limnocylindrales bacterium]